MYFPVTERRVIRRGGRYFGGFDGEARIFRFDAAATGGSDLPTPAAVARDLAFVIKRATGSLDVTPPRDRVCGFRFEFRELREVCDEASVEKANVFRAAGRGEFLEDRQLYARGVWESDRQLGVCSKIEDDMEIRVEVTRNIAALATSGANRNATRCSTVERFGTKRDGVTWL